MSELFYRKYKNVYVVSIFMLAMSAAAGYEAIGTRGLMALLILSIAWILVNKFGNYIHHAPLFVLWTIECSVVFAAVQRLISHMPDAIEILTWALLAGCVLTQIVIVQQLRGKWHFLVVMPAVLSIGLLNVGYLGWAVLLKINGPTILLTILYINQVIMLFIWWFVVEKWRQWNR